MQRWIDTKSRVAFTLAFITEVSKIHQVGITKGVDERYALRFGFKFNKKTMTILMFITSTEKMVMVWQKMIMKTLVIL